jgi:nitrite reductase/ring-hydroxylating ferredoxin subunit
MSLRDSNRAEDAAGQPLDIPKWREDFPYESEGDDFITRRDFTRFLCVISAGFATGNGWILWKALREKGEALPEVEIARTTDLQPGEWRVFNYPDDKTPAMLIRRLNGEFIAFMQKCTHLSCPVEYEKSRNGKEESLVCHCHNGLFDINNGEGIAGPPREFRPLPQLSLRIDGDRIVATGVMRGEGLGRG